LAQSCPEGEALFEKLQTNYNTCMNTTTVKAEAEKGLAIESVLSEIAGIFPIEDYASNDTIAAGDDSMVALQAYFNTIGVAFLTDYQVVAIPQAPVCAHVGSLVCRGYI
jgi:hypothetical protein